MGYRTLATFSFRVAVAERYVAMSVKEVFDCELLITEVVKRPLYDIECFLRQPEVSKKFLRLFLQFFI